MNKAPKYRSKERDIPINIHFYDKTSQKNKQEDIYDLNLNYSSNGPAFNEIIFHSINFNEKKIKENFGDLNLQINNSFNYLYEYASLYLSLIYAPILVERNPATKIIFPCFHKSLIGLYSAFFLTCKGFWGAARPLIRLTFESIIIAKFCSVNYESDVFDKWIDGMPLFFSNSILKKIEKPKTEEFKKFWTILNGFTHSSIYSSQPDIKVSPDLKNIQLNLVFIEMMLVCKYHLLNSHLVTTNLKYYQTVFDNKYRARELRTLINANNLKMKKNLGKDGKALIRDYKSTWITKE